MAITIQQAPGFGQSLLTPVWHKALSTNYTATNFRYVFDIYIGGNLISRLKVFPDGDFGLVNVATVIREYISNYFLFNPSGSAVLRLFTRTNEIFVEYQVQYGEEYSAGGVTTTYTNLANGTYRAFNAYADFMPADGLPYNPLYNKGYSFITDRIVPIKAVKGERLLLPFFNLHPTGSGLNWQPVVTPYDLNGNPLPTTTGAAFNATEALLNLDLAAIAAVSSATGPNVGGYFIYLQSGLKSTPTLKVKYVCTPKNPSAALHFMNRYGGFETFTFNAVNREEIQSESKTFRRLPTVLEGGVIKEYSNLGGIYADSLIQYHTQMTSTRKLQSGYLKDQDHIWLKQLVMSSTVYMEKYDCFFPVVIKTNKWSERTSAADKVYNLELEVEVGRQIFSQSR